MGARLGSREGVIELGPSPRTPRRANRCPNCGGALAEGRAGSTGAAGPCLTCRARAAAAPTGAPAPLPEAPLTARLPRTPEGSARPDLALVRCFRCGRRGLIPSRLLLSQEPHDILCPVCRPAGPGGRPGALLMAVRCFRCGRRGRLSAARRVALAPEQVLCPRCRDAPTPRPALPVPSIPAAMAPPTLPVLRRAPLIGRPPMIMVLSRPAPAAPSVPVPSPRVPAAAPTPRPSVAVVPRSTVPASIVRCFKCGRRGRLPIRVQSSLRAEEILCPKCRGTFRPLRPLRGTVAVRCFECGRQGRIPMRPQATMRPERILCPSCRGRRGGAGPHRARSRAKNPRPVPAGEWAPTV